MKIRIKIKVSKTVQPLAQKVASIDDLLTEILLRLPIKSLVRYKLVSKHWHSLITSPKFCILRNPNPNPAIGLFLCCPPSAHTNNPVFEYVPFSITKPTNPPFRKLKFTKDLRGITILQSCNGLLLCCSSRSSHYEKRYYVYNPTTKKYTSLPRLDRGYGISIIINGMSLAFDPVKSPHYRVVCVRASELEYGEYNYRLQLDVYSSETGLWRECGRPFTAEVNFEDGVYWNGAIHWISYEIGDSLYFNLEDERLGMMPMQPILDEQGWRGRYYFGESCDRLHYIELFGAFGPQVQFNVYEMKRDYSEWFVKYQVDLSQLAAANPAIGPHNDEYSLDEYYTYSVFALVRGEKDEDSFLILHILGKAIRYNFLDKTFETLLESEGDKVKGCLKFPTTQAFQYIESLCCV